MIFELNKPLPDSTKSVNRTSGNTRVCREGENQKLLSNKLIGKDGFRSTLPCRHGYIRVSTRAQTTDRQTEALAAHCDELHIEHISAVADERPVFETVLKRLNPGDTFVVLDLDRAFRSSVDAMLTAEALRSHGVTFRILSLQVDTGTPEGELFYSLMAAFAQFERRIIARRTKEGLAAARKRGVKLGRPAKLTDRQIAEAYIEMETSNLSCRDIAEGLGVSRLTLQRGFQRLNLDYPVRDRKS